MIELNLYDFETESGKLGAKYTVCLERNEKGIRCQVFSATSGKKELQTKILGQRVFGSSSCSGFTFLFV